MEETLFIDRFDAGEKLAGRLREYSRRDDVVILALPRGGVPVGYMVAESLAAPLDVFIVRKLGVPGQEELAMGAIASGGLMVLNEEVIRVEGVPWAAVEDAARRESAVIAEREVSFRRGRPPLEIAGKTTILVDDGLATGSTMRASARAVRQKGPAWVVVAVPVAPPETCDDLQEEADDVVCVETPPLFYSVGTWYRDFAQTSDREVEDLLERAAGRQAAGSGAR